MAEEHLQERQRLDDRSDERHRGATQELPDAESARELLRTMALIRLFEEEAGRQYQRAKAGGFLHLAIGEEATIVGTTSVMRPEDYLIGTYRTHGHALARGTDPGTAAAVPRRPEGLRHKRDNRQLLLPSAFCLLRATAALTLSRPPRSAGAGRDTAGR